MNLTNFTTSLSSYYAAFHLLPVPMMTTNKPFLTLS